MKKENSPKMMKKQLLIQDTFQIRSAKKHRHVLVAYELTSRFKYDSTQTAIDTSKN